ncbi:hypothetical protein [Oceanobacillus salinisoli]|uniref:hypothetical protein n=1 Tax=Oceanobacillus salinisoli TaxID=2678611 RepID=UPI0012E195C3|nr:hypothetical protein [Oceanobacillus salinisoli]
MYFSKKIFIYIIIILLVASIYKDLSLGTEPNENVPTQETTIQINENYSAMKVKVTSGDTVLSIVENINEGKGEIAIDQMMTDFQQLNPEVNPYRLQPNTFYYFPVYEL